MRRGVLVALIFHHSVAWAGTSADVFVGGDSRGTAAVGGDASVRGVNCDLADVDGSLGHLRGDAPWSADARVDLCPWTVGIMDTRIHLDRGVGILPDLSDRYVVASRTPYRHSGWGVEIELFDLLDFVTPRLVDPATLHAAKPTLSLERATWPARDRVYLLPFWIDHAMTTQDGRSLEEESWAFALSRWRHDDGTVDFVYVDIAAATWGDGVGVSPLTFYPVRITDLAIDRVTFDLAGGWTQSSGTQSNPQFTTVTPPALDGVTIAGGHALAHVQVVRDRWVATVGADRTMAPYLADGLSIDDRALAGATWTPSRGPLDRIDARGWAARTTRLASDATATRDATWGGALALGAPLRRNLRLDLTGEVGRSFYARSGTAALPALGAQVSAQLSAAFGRAR